MQLVATIKLPWYNVDVAFESQKRPFSGSKLTLSRREFDETGRSIFARQTFDRLVS